jgi:hypothetical protein
LNWSWEQFDSLNRVVIHIPIYATALVKSDKVDICLSEIERCKALEKQVEREDGMTKPSKISTKPSKTSTRSTSTIAIS